MTNESYSHDQLRCGTKLLWELILICRLAIFCVLRELIFAIRTDCFFLLGRYLRFLEIPGQIIDNIFVFIEYGQWKSVFQKKNVRFACPKPVIVLFCMKETSYTIIEQTRILSTAHFLCSEFKLENIYSGVNFCGEKCLP